VDVSRRRGRSIVITLLLLAANVTCSVRSRPSLESWSQIWKATRARIPARSDFERADDARVLCNRMLVTSKEARSALIPTPDASLDTAVQAWMERVGGLAFDCPSARGETEPFDAAMREIAILDAEIEAGLLAISSR